VHGGLLAAGRRILTGQQLVVEVDEALGRRRLGGLGRPDLEMSLQQTHGRAHDTVPPRLIVAAAKNPVLLHGEALLEQLQRVLRVDHDHVGRPDGLLHGHADQVDGQGQCVFPEEIESADALLGQLVVEKNPCDELAAATSCGHGAGCLTYRGLRCNR